MKRAVAVRHVAFEDLGAFEPLLQEAGYVVEYRDATGGQIVGLDPLGPDLLIVLGGPIGVYDAADYPFLQAEIRLLEQRLGADRPTLGICLGSQLMARALGARVYPGGQPEIGWAPLHLTDAGRASPLAELAPERTAVLHWHGDTFDLPAGAVRLASTARYPNQAFAWGRRGLAMQFHPEVTAEGLEAWYVGHAVEIKHSAGVSVAGLRADAGRWAGQLRRCSDQFLGSWLASFASTG